MTGARMPQVELKVTLAWWWWPYYWGLVTTCIVMRTEPDWGKIEAVITRAMRLRLVEGDRFARDAAAAVRADLFPHDTP